ncbi:MAG: hypothetical protein GY798_27480 [Hyphomicrobiales bacterium]|nr:hypothetical protein [Hyphomicrobiales bacterium]
MDAKKLQDRYQSKSSRPSGKTARRGCREEVQRRQLVVLGMHRSGTSVFTSVVERLGFFVGEAGELTSGSWENPHGFFERRDLRNIYDRLLDQSGADWWKVSDFDPNSVSGSVVEQQRPNIKSLVSRLDKQGRWAIKEPRLCFLLPIFVPVLGDPAALIVVRHPPEIASSLRRRNGIPTFAGLALWEAYMTAALRYSDHTPRAFVNYHDLMVAPGETVEALANSLVRLGFGELAVDGVAGQVDFSLYSERVNQIPVEDQLSPPQIRLWHQLQTGVIESEDVACSAAAGLVPRQYESDENVATGTGGGGQAERWFPRTQSGSVRAVGTKSIDGRGSRSGCGNPNG